MKFFVALVNQVRGRLRSRISARISRGLEYALGELLKLLGAPVQKVSHRTSFYVREIVHVANRAARQITKAVAVQPIQDRILRLLPIRHRERGVHVSESRIAPVLVVFVHLAGLSNAFSLAQVSTTEVYPS